MGKQKGTSLIFLGSLATLIISLATFLSNYDNWYFIVTPKSVGHILLIIGTFITSIYSALRLQMPRHPHKRIYRDRISDKKLFELNKNDKGDWDE